jgi:hypothetical protein
MQSLHSRTYVHKLPSDIHVTPLVYNFLSMKLSITPAEVSGYSLSITSSSSTNVLGCTKIFRGCRGIFSQNEHGDDSCTDQFLLQDKIPDFPFPFRGRVCEFRVEFLGALPVGGTPADLEFEQEFSGDIFPVGQDFVPVELGSRCKL